MDDWKPRMIDLEKLTAELNANTTDLRVSTDQSIESLVAGQFDVEGKCNASKE